MKNTIESDAKVSALESFAPSAEELAASVSADESVLVDVLGNGGCFDETQVDTLARAFPSVRVGVKFGQSLRCACTFATVKREIESRLANGDWVREAYIVADEFDRLRAERGLPAY